MELIINNLICTAIDWIAIICFTNLLLFKCIFRHEDSRIVGINI